MLILPPSPPASGTTRSGDRRVRQRRTRAAGAAAPEDVAAEAAAEPQPVVRRMPPRSRGRRKTDHDPSDAPSEPARSRAGRPYAPLIAQLIATALGLEQTRARRRGAPEQASALYAAKPARPKRDRGEA